MMFLSTTLLAFGLGICRGEAFESIWQYNPKTKVTDLAAIDQDLYAVTRELRKKNFASAEAIYKEGGHSGSYATLHLEDALDAPLEAGTVIIGPTPIADGSSGPARAILRVDANIGTRSLVVDYEVSTDQDFHVGCQVGALADTYTVGCFNSTGTLTLPDQPNKAFQYHYDLATENDNTRTIFGLNEQTKKWSDTAFLFKYLEYFGTENYLDEITTAAFHFREPEGLFRGTMDFSIYQEKGNKEIVEFAIPVMTMLANVVGNMEDAVEQCNRGCTKASCHDKPGMFEWDSAVAYYAGARLDLPNDKGDFLFAFADTRCSEFRTCGLDGKSAVGFAKVNHDSFRLFNEGQKMIEASDCSGLKTTKERIEGMMTIPLIQGTLRYAHMVQGEMIVGNIEKHNAEASIFALSVLPQIHKCNPLDAEIIFDHLKPKPTTDVDYQVVKHAFEKNYDCLNIQCLDVGGIYDYHNGTYRWDSPPCGTLRGQALTASKGGKWLLSFIIIFAVILLFVAAYCLCNRCGSDIEAEGKADGEDDATEDNVEVQLGGNSEDGEHEIA